MTQITLDDMTRGGREGWGLRWVGGGGRCVAFIPELYPWCYNNSVFPFSGSS